MAAEIVEAKQQTHQLIDQLSRNLPSPTRLLQEMSQ
jgi:hypothetical protein